MHRTMKAFFNLLVYGFTSSILIAQQAQAAVITLYGVQQPLTTQTTVSVEQLGTTIVSAIGPGESGRTRYEIQDIHSLIIYHDPQASTTFTGVDSPITATWTFEQGASQIYKSSPPATHTGANPHQQLIYEGVVANCSLDISKGTGVCVAQKERLASSHTSIVTTTYTGSIIPLATITTSNGFQMAARNSVVVVGSAVLAGVLAGTALIFV